MASVMQNKMMLGLYINCFVYYKLLYMLIFNFKILWLLFVPVSVLFYTCVSHQFCFIN